MSVWGVGLRGFLERAAKSASHKVFRGMYCYGFEKGLLFDKGSVKGLHTFFKGVWGGVHGFAAWAVV